MLLALSPFRKDSSVKKKPPSNEYTTLVAFCDRQDNLVKLHSVVASLATRFNEKAILEDVEDGESDGLGLD